MEEKKSILHELYVFSEWKPEPEYLQKQDNILPENISAFWCWLNFFGPKKSLLDSITAYKERQHKWHIAVGDEGKVIAVLTDNILEIRTKRSDYATIAARTTVNRDPYPQWRKLVWSPDCTFVVLAYGNGHISFYDLTASNLFDIPADCSRPDGRECTDNTHAVADIIFMSSRTKDVKWNWEVVVVTFEGKLRGYMVSLSACSLRHRFRLGAGGGVAAARYCARARLLYVAGAPHPHKDPTSPLSAGITAWRLLNDEPFYKLSVVSGELEQQLAKQGFQVYIPFFTSKNLAFIVQMVLSPDGSKLVCLHCNGDVSVWHLPTLKLLQRWPLALQPLHDLNNPLVKERPAKKDPSLFYPADVNWWTDSEIILSRFSGAVSVCGIEDMMNILGKQPEFFQGSPKITFAFNGTFMVLECETNVLPAKKSSDESMEMVAVESENENSTIEMTKELIKTILFAITDMETFQPKPKKITIVSRIYRLLGVKSTTPDELFNRKIESGHYAEALTLAQTFDLDSDLVYQQQWRKNPVSTEAIQKYLSKVSKKVWAVHQCVDRLPETLPAARELLQFGLRLADERILDEINKDRDVNDQKDPDDITLEDLNAYTSELLRCRHVMLFYKERLALYEAILRTEKSTYQKDEYHRLRSNSIVHSAIEIAKEGRIQALTCLWPYIKTIDMQFAVLSSLPETVNPIEYQHLLPTKHPLEWFEKKSPIKIKPYEHENDWCRKEIFRSIWCSNWSEDTTPDSEQPSTISVQLEDVAKWYDKRAREIEERSGLVSHALTLVTIATVGGGVEGLDHIMFHLLTLDTLIYDINVEAITLSQLEKMSTLETCIMLMEMSTPATFVSDLKAFVIPFLKRYEKLCKVQDACLNGLIEYLEHISVNDLSSILLVLQSPSEFELDVRTHLELAERCIFAHTGTDQLDMACDLLDTILKESDGSISGSQLVRRVKEIERLVAGSSRVAWRGVSVPPRALRRLRADSARAHALLTRLARALPAGPQKPTQQDWEKLLKDILELQSMLFENISKEQCHEIYASSLLTSGDAASIKLASDVLTCEPNGQRSLSVNYARSVELVLGAAREYFNSASSLTDPALELARCCLTLIKDDNKEIQEELDLISALPILNAFNLTIIPIQDSLAPLVGEIANIAITNSCRPHYSGRDYSSAIILVRLCEERMSLIEECLKLDPHAFLASHKLLKLAKLLRVAGDDDHRREGQVLQLIGEYALSAGPAGHAAAAAAARRLAALRCAPAAALLARVALAASGHADRASRRALLAAAVTHCNATSVEQILEARLELELEDLQQMGAALKDHHVLEERCPSTDDEFADAITTPVIEKKDLVAPHQEKKLPLFNYLMDTIHNKFASGDKTSTTEPVERTVHCQEFYRTLYPEHDVSDTYYRYDRFSTPNEDNRFRGHAALKWFYIQHCDSYVEPGVEAEVVRKCAEEILYKDTPLSVSCLLHTTQDLAQTKKMIETQNSDTAVSAALYATLMKCNAPELRDNVYLTKPSKMARTTLQKKNASQEQLDIIRQCIDKLSGMGEVETLRRHGFNVNGLLFHADRDYRAETIYRVARSTKKEHLELAVSLGKKYGIDGGEVWLQHARGDASLAHLAPDAALPELCLTIARIKEELWPILRGDDHSALIKYFTILKKVDEKPLMAGLTAAEHIRMLKKAKAASPELNYKLLLDQPSSEEFTAHILSIIKAENVGLLTKFLRGLPPAFKIPVSVNTIYTMWLTKYFFSVPAAAESNKKWMQQYRQCASYFNKLSQEELLKFVANTCFCCEAVHRVPAGTRNLMIMQAVDYCQQEQENDFKFNKNELTWTQVGQELTRWARFLENYHSTTIQTIIDNSCVPRDEIWAEIEMSHGDPDKIIECLSRLVGTTDIKASAITTLLQCLNVDAGVADVLRPIVDLDIETAVHRITQYHKEGVKMPDDLLEQAMQKATEANLPAHKLIGLLSIRQRAQIHDNGDLSKIAHFSVDLFRGEWPELDYEEEITEAKLMSEEGRRKIFAELTAKCDSWQRKKALVDVLACWPPARDGDKPSVHCEYVHGLLAGGDRKENLVLIKLLLRKPLLSDQEVKWLANNTPSESVVNAIWTALLSKCEHSKDVIMNLLSKHKETVLTQEIEDDLIAELLDNSMFIQLVPTPLYPSVINYIINRESTEPASPYTVQWASTELLKANFVAEAGHLQLTAMGVPAALRGFSESVLYVKNMFMK